MPSSIRDLDLQDHQTGRTSIGSNRAQGASDQMYRHADQRNQSGQLNVSATHPRFHHAFVNGQYTPPTYNSNIQVHETYRTFHELPITREQLAAESGQAFHAPIGSSINTVEASCWSDAAYSILRCDQPLSTHALNQARPRPGGWTQTQRRESGRHQFSTETQWRATSGDAFGTQSHDPMERWKKQSFHDSPWNNIDHVGRQAREPATPASGRRTIKAQSHGNSNPS